MLVGPVPRVLHVIAESCAEQGRGEAKPEVANAIFFAEHDRQFLLTGPKLAGPGDHDGCFST